MRQFLMTVTVLGLAFGAEAQNLLSSRPAPAARPAATAGRTGLAANAGASAAGEAKSSVIDETEESGKQSDLNLLEAPADMVFAMYAKLVDRTVLPDPGIPKAAITIQSRPGQHLTKEEQIHAIEVVLEMNGIHLENYGDKFVRALPRAKARQEGIPLILDPDAELEDSGKVVSLLFTFKNIPTDEAKTMLEGLKSQNGQLLIYERIGAILVTDTMLNIRRMREIARAVDVATPVNENVFVRQIVNANANEIKTALEQIVQESQKELEKQGRNANRVREDNWNNRRGDRMMGRNLLQRPGTNAQAAPAETKTSGESLVTSVSDADRGMIRGKVLILADERSNKLIVVTAKSNMDFFDRVITQLDVVTTPDVEVKVYRLKYANAEDVSDMINDLIGNASGSKSNTKNNQNQNASRGGNANMTQNPQRSNANRPTNAAGGAANSSRAGELSKDNVTVLADKRINGLVVMARREDVPTLEKIIESMDIKLSQVLIETMILQVTLSDEIATGIDWVTGLANRKGGMQGLSGGAGSGTLSVANVGTITMQPGADAAAIVPGSAGLNYYAVSKALNLGAIVQASKADSRAKLVASPIIMTLDNKEATIQATRMRYLLKGYTYSGSTYNGSAVPDYEQADIGLVAKITPKINPNGTVMLTVDEEFSALGDSQIIQAATGGTSNNTQVVSGISVETTVKRKLTADITVENRQTVILGGLVQAETTQADTGIPILKDIPWIGRYLFGSTKDVETRQELLMFLTPYVLDDAEAAVFEAARRKGSLSDPRPWDDHGWSDSPLADPISEKEVLNRLKRQWSNEDAEWANEQKKAEALKERAETLKERAGETSEDADLLAPLEQESRESKTAPEPTSQPVEAERASVEKETQS